MFLVVDVFPAVVAFYTEPFAEHFVYPFLNVGVADSPNKIFNDSRVIVHKNFLIVGINSPQGPALGFKGEVDEVFKDASSSFYRVLLKSGVLVVFAPSKGCGCGSRLRSWSPYGSILSV